MGVVTHAITVGVGGLGGVVEEGVLVAYHPVAVAIVILESAHITADALGPRNAPLVCGLTGVVAPLPGVAGLPASIAGLLVSNVWVLVGPPLS